MTKDRKSMQEEQRGKTTREKHAKGKKTDKPEANAGTTEERPEDIEEAEESNAEVEDAVNILAEKIREHENKYLRLAAEYDNYRKRTLREKADLTKFAGAEIISDMLPVVDDLDLAVEAMTTTDDIDAIKKGIELIHGKFRDFLSRKGVREIEAMGTEFDTDVHEAVARVPAPDNKGKGKVVDVIKKGYMLNDRVIRYAKVVIGE